MGKAIYNNSTFTFNPKYLKIGHDNSSQEMSMGKRSDTYLEKSQLVNSYSLVIKSKIFVY